MPPERFLFYIASVVLLRTAQATMLCGMVRSKNAASMGVRLLLDLAVLTLALWTIGAMFVPDFSNPSLITLRHFAGIAPSAWGAYALLPALALCTAPIFAAAAERSRLLPLLGLSAMSAAFLLPLVGQVPRFIGAGLDSTSDFIPIAVVCGGVLGMFSAYFVGPRKGKFNRDQSVNFLPGHHVVFQIIGLLFMVGVLMTSRFPSIGILLGASAATIFGAAYGRVRFGKIDPGLLFLAVIGGLLAAAILPSNAPTWLSVIAGTLCGILVPWTVLFFEGGLRLDDACGLAIAYLCAGAIGWILWIAAETLGLLPQGPVTFSIVENLAVLAAAIVGSAIVAIVVLSLSKRFNHLRVSEAAEFEGADLSELDVNAYPDFQQNMIKSHHMREL